MILKSLVLHGFKSFADKTELHFDRGITGVVGPNGCGKSNIVDAIRWVLGTQSAKSLRGSQMLDVVFNGSGTRKPSGMAQVDLVFDNEDRKLPLDQTEVTVTRRLFRSGESEYLINKQVCRLRDVRELFLDTGVGVDAYSVIEQGKVDALLRANPLDRRLIFEEAAGVSKYKARKKEAQRRLERVNQNLLRLQDIIDELEKRLRSLKVQAGKARHYQEYTHRLRELRSTYSLAEYHRLTETLTALESTSTALSDQSTALRTQLGDHEAGSSKANIEILDLESRISEADGRLLTVQSQMAAHEERIVSCDHRRGEQQEAAGRARTRLVDVETALAAQTARLDDLAARCDELEATLSQANARVSELQATDVESAARQTQAAADLDDAKAAIIELMRKASQVENEINTLDLQRESLRRETQRLRGRQGEMAEQAAGLEHKARGHAERCAALDQVIAEQSARVDEAQRRAAAVAESRADLLSRLGRSKEARSGLESRRQTLDELDRRREGMLVGPREVLARRDGDESGRAFAYVRGALSELFETDVEHAAVVEAVLAPIEHHLVVTERDSLLADSAALAALEGRVHAFCLDQVPPVLSGPDLSVQPGVVGPLLGWVRVPDDCQHLARHLLGGTYVVETLADAQRLSATFRSQVRFVTPAGEVVDGDGHVAVGSARDGGGLISRRSELRELAGRIAALSSEIGGLTEQLVRTDSEAVSLEAAQQELRTAVFQARSQRVEAQALKSAVDEEYRRLSSERPLVEQELVAVDRQIDQTAARRGAAEASARETGQKRIEADSRVVALQADVERYAVERRTLSEQLTQARIAASEQAQRRAAVAESLRELRLAVTELEAERSAAAAEVEECERRIAQLERQATEAREALERFSAEREALSAQAAALRERREMFRRELDEHAAEIRRIRAELEEVEHRLHEQEVALHEARVRRDELVSRVRDELGVELAERYAEYVHAEQDWSAVEAEIADLKEKIERLGNVNLEAISEQEELEKRHAFLTGQRDDLRDSEKQLTELIDKLNAESVDRFMRTFGEIREHFGALFKKLFGGGKADVFMENAADVLESGIEIMARPPGKELQSMSLMSGGEKTMTAIALLLAVFKTRPSPFTLLDEVDAALDEANNTRFNHVIQEFVTDTQFIIITHSKRTMGIADVLYGITMQEAGVSKRVSVKFETDSPQAAVA